MKKSFYIYVYLDPNVEGIFKYGDITFNFEPFYIGKGSKSRDRYHLWSVINGKARYNSHKVNRISKIIKSGLIPIITRISRHETEFDAYEQEIYWIKTIGRRDLGTGPLTNQNDGGENQGNISDDVKRIISEKVKSDPLRYIRFKGENNPMYGVRRLGESSPRYGIPCTPENKKKYSEIHKGKRYSPKTEFKKGQIPWNKGRKGSQVAWNKGLKKDDYEKR